MPPGQALKPIFYFDVVSPWCWLTAERIASTLGADCDWQPISVPEAGLDRAAVEAAAGAQGYAMRWPDPWPSDSRLAMLAATFAKQTGRAIAFTLAAMRQQFLAGRDLAVEDNVLIAAAASELHPRAVLAGVASRGVQHALDAATDEAAGRGVVEVPTFAVGSELIAGPQALEQVEALAR